MHGLALRTLRGKISQSRHQPARLQGELSLETGDGTARRYSPAVLLSPTIFSLSGAICVYVSQCYVLTMPVRCFPEDARRVLEVVQLERRDEGVAHVGERLVVADHEAGRRGRVRRG